MEDLFTEDREWALADWRTRYLEHPLTRTIGRRLIWTLLRDGDANTAMPDGDGFVAADGSAVDVGADGPHPAVAPDRRHRDRRSPPGGRACSRDRSGSRSSRRSARSTS